jgi:hypothetical protein
MAQQITAGMAPASDVVTIESRPAYQSYQILHWGFVLGMLVGGVDIFLQYRQPDPAAELLRHCAAGLHPVSCRAGIRQTEHGA